MFEDRTAAGGIFPTLQAAVLAAREGVSVDVGRTSVIP